MTGKKGEPNKKLAPLKGWRPRPATPRPELRREISEDEMDVFSYNIHQLHRDYGELLKEEEHERVHPRKERGAPLPPVTSAPIVAQNNAPATPETVAHQSSATTTTSPFVTTTPLPQPPLGPRPPTGPKKKNTSNRGRPVVWKQSTAMVDISPEKPELISFDVPPVLAPRPPTLKADGNHKHTNLVPRPPASKPEGNRRHTKKFIRTTQKSARQRRTTKPSDAQTVQHAGAMKPHPPPAQPKQGRLLHKRPQISNTEKIYPTTDHGKDVKVMGRQDDQSIEDDTTDYMHGEEIFIFDMDLGEDDAMKPAKATCKASRAPSSEKPAKITFEAPRAPSSEDPEEIPEELSA